jgi:transposase
LALLSTWDERIAAVPAEIEALVEQDESCQRLMTVPGVGPILSSAVVAAIGNGAGFKQGRDFGAWLGLVPKQESTGDRTIPGRISKRGNKVPEDCPDDVITNLDRYAAKLAA